MIRARYILSALLVITATTVVCVRCSPSAYQGEIWSGGVVAALGGAVLATQKNGVVAYEPPNRKLDLLKLPSFLKLIPEAYAAAAVCPNLTQGTCLGTASNQLVVYYNNCQQDGTVGGAIWLSYVYLEFPTAADCSAVQASGFTPAVVAGLDGKKVTRGFGNPAGGTQANFRVARNNEGVQIFTSFPSGWSDPNVIGGSDINFSGGARRIVVNGIHAIARTPRDHSSLLDSAPHLETLFAIPIDQFNTPYDYTVNSVKSGTVLLTKGKSITRAADGTITFGATQSNVMATFDGDATWQSNKIAIGALFRTQHNLDHSIALSAVTQALDYSDTTCCWPTAGVIHTEFDLSLNRPWDSDDLTFNSPCGSVHYDTSAGDHVSETLNHCY